MDSRQLSLVPNLKADWIRCGHCKTHKHPSEYYGQKMWCKACRKADQVRRRKDDACIVRHKDKYANNREFRAHAILKRVQKRAKVNGLEFDLDHAWVLERLNSGCEVSGLPYDFSAEGAHIRQPFGPSVDRILAGGGYTKRNCRMILMCLNTAFMDWGMERFLPVVKAVYEKQGLGDK